MPQVISAFVPEGCLLDAQEQARRLVHSQTRQWRRFTPSTQRFLAVERAVEQEPTTVTFDLPPALHEPSSHRTRPDKRKALDALAASSAKRRLHDASPTVSVAFNAPITSLAPANPLDVIGQGLLLGAIPKDLPQPHRIASRKAYSHNYPRSPAQIRDTLAEIAALEPSNPGFWLIPVTRSSVTTMPHLSAPTWDVNAKEEPGQPKPIVWSFHRLRALWNFLRKWNDTYGGLVADCYFEQDSPIKHGDHLRLRCQFDMALALRDGLNLVHVNNISWIKRTVLVWCTLDGKAVITA